MSAEGLAGVRGTAGRGISALAGRDGVSAGQEGVGLAWKMRTVRKRTDLGWVLLVPSLLRSGEWLSNGMKRGNHGQNLACQAKSIGKEA